MFPQKRGFGVKRSDRITKAIFDAIDEINEQLPAGGKLEKSVDTVLYDRTGRLDSLKLVNLIVATEERIESEFDILVVLATDKAVAHGRNPFRTVRSFADYVAGRLGKEGK